MVSIRYLINTKINVKAISSVIVFNDCISKWICFRSRLCSIFRSTDNDKYFPFIRRPYQYNFKVTLQIQLIQAIKSLLHNNYQFPGNFFSFFLFFRSKWKSILKIIFSFFLWHLFHLYQLLFNLAFERTDKVDSWFFKFNTNSVWGSNWKELRLQRHYE